MYIKKVHIDLSTKPNIGIFTIPYVHNLIFPSHNLIYNNTFLRFDPARVIIQWHYLILVVSNRLTVDSSSHIRTKPVIFVQNPFSRNLYVDYIQNFKQSELPILKIIKILVLNICKTPSFSICITPISNTSILSICKDPALFTHSIHILTSHEPPCLFIFLYACKAALSMHTHPQVV